MDRKLKTGLWMLALAGAMLLLLVEQQEIENLRAQLHASSAQVVQLQAESETLLARLAQADRLAQERLPASAIGPRSNAAAPAGQLQGTNLFARFGKEPQPLTSEQVEAYLKANGRSAQFLLAAYRTSHNPELLQEAMEKFPGDPRVAFEAVYKKDLSAEQRRQWLNSFEQAAPDNPLANYLSARDYFKAGQTAQALQELQAASGKPNFQDYTLDRRQEDEEAYLAAGYTPAAAKMIASGQLMLPQLSELKQLGQQMVDLADSYRKAGDDASAQAVLQMTLGLGQSYGAGDCAISHLVAMAIERKALSAMEPTSPYGPNGQTIQDRLNELTEQKTQISSLFRQGTPLLETMSEQDWISYIDREKMYGETAAMKWALAKFGPK